MKDTSLLVSELVARYGNKRESLLPILQGVFDEQRYVSDEAMVEIARHLDISSAEVYGKATFYHFLSTKPLGKYVIRVCKTIVCDMKNKKEIVATLENLLKIKMGETTNNRKFSLLYTNCLGWCHKAPAMLVNDEVYTELTPDKVRDIVTMYKNK
ncbi:MAG: NADH-quinone oxidoreductase subunit NuoE [Ignavibacteria bacterium]|nr:NADH-quinone oxidoreductase subunit NuoE [Ignavibacteria bacterium]